MDRQRKHERHHVEDELGNRVAIDVAHYLFSKNIGDEYISAHTNMALKGCQKQVLSAIRGRNKEENSTLALL